MVRSESAADRRRSWRRDWRNTEYVVAVAEAVQSLPGKVSTIVLTLRACHGSNSNTSPGWTRQYVNYQINGAKVRAALPEKVTTIVVTEAQAHEFGKVAPVERERALKSIVESGEPVTSRRDQTASAAAADQKE
jgi:hypothetical protein